MLVELVIGDAMGDGHGIHTSQYVHVQSASEMLEAYHEGSKILGFSFIDEVGAEDDNAKVPTHILQKLNDNGIAKEMDTEDWDAFGIDTDQFAEIFLSIAQLGNPNFHYKIHKMESVDIGGYGLF